MARKSSNRWCCPQVDRREVPPSALVMPRCRVPDSRRVARAQLRHARWTHQVHQSDGRVEPRGDPRHVANWGRPEGVVESYGGMTACTTRPLGAEAGGRTPSFRPWCCSARSRRDEAGFRAPPQGRRYQARFAADRNRSCDELPPNRPIDPVAEGQCETHCASRRMACRRQHWGSRYCPTPPGQPQRLAQQSPAAGRHQTLRCARWPGGTRRQGATRTHPRRIP